MEQSIILTEDERELIVRNAKFSMSVDGKHLLKLDPDSSALTAMLIRERADKNRALINKLNELAY